MGLFSRSLLLCPLLALTLSVGCEENPSQPAQKKAITNHVALRQSQPIQQLAVLADTAQTLADSHATLLSISPSLPAGLEFDPVSGRITGTPIAQATATTYTITSVDSRGSSDYHVSIAIDGKLPGSITSLAAGFHAEVVLHNAQVPVRMALAADGRLFYAELQTGNIRIIDPINGLLPQPFATVPVVTGVEKGLLGLVLDPNFSINGYVYVHATVGGHQQQPDHAEIIRYTALDNTGVNPVVIVDNLPIADVHNGGDLVFDHTGHLLVGRGDVNDPATSQRQGDLSGKVLRYTSDGAIPDDNPFPGDAEWSKGLRNTFALAIHPQTGDLFGADAGPTSDDKLNFLQPGKNFLWGMEEEPQGSSIGYSVRIWQEVITPTGLLFHSGTGGFTDYHNQLFVSSYNTSDIRVIHLAGEAYTDFIREEVFATFDEENFGSKPLHLIESATGELYISTFDSIFKVYRSN